MSALRHSFRSLMRSPRYALIAIAFISLGLGACTAVFSLFDSLLMRERSGIAQPHTLVDIGRTQNGRGFDNFAFPDFVDLRDHTHTLSEVAAIRGSLTAAALVIDRAAEPARNLWVTPNFLRVLGTRLALGRDFRDDGRPAGELILSHRFWETRFARDPAVIGRTVVFNQVDVTIVGVAEAGFTGNSLVAPDFWAPLSLWDTIQPGSKTLTSRGSVGFIGLGRLHPGFTREQAQAELSTLARQLEQTYPDTNKGRGFAVAPSSRLPGSSGELGVFISLLGTLALLTLVVACTNIGGLMIARSTLRRRELAVRAALGADRKQLIRLLLGEHLALFAVGSAGGLLVAVWLIDLFRAALTLAPQPIALTVAVSPWAAAFALGVALLAGLGCGLGPALGGTRFAVLASLRTGEQPAGSRFFSLRNLFLTAQLTVSLALLVPAGLLTRSLQKLAAIDPGYDLARIEAASFDFSTIGLADAPAAEFQDALLEGVTALPQVESAAWSVALPLSGANHGFGRLRLPGAESNQEIRTAWNLVSPEYFATVRLALLRGRNFSATDRRGTPLVAIVNETFARNLWPDRDPLGQTLVNQDNQPVTIVGVARDAKYSSIGESPRNFIYCPIAQLGNPRASLLVRSRDGRSTSAFVRGAVGQLQANLPIAEIKRLEEVAAASLLPQRIAFFIAGGAGVFALLLSATGVYGATLFWTSTRTREFGVRTALGATFEQLVGFALRGSLRTLAVAVAAGLLGGVALTQLMSAALMRIALDPLVLVSAPALFTLLILVAAWLPARRAAKVDPMVALRAE